jgi:hypothetical protein
MRLETKITEEYVKKKLDKIAGDFPCQSISEYNRGLPLKEHYKSKEQYCASRILYALDGIISDYSDPGNYIDYISNHKAFPDELKNLVQNHNDKIINERKKNPLTNLLMTLVGEELEKVKRECERRRKKEIKEKEKLNAELKKYRAVYIKMFEKMNIPKKYWWDKK